jgi:signal transduction histidine kinase
MLIEIENLSLFITAISYAIAFVLTTLFGIWVYLKSSRKASHVTFLLLCLSVSVFQIIHIFGITVADSFASTIILRFSVITAFIVPFTIHWIASVVERAREYRFTIVSSYAVAAALVVFYLLVPGAYLETSIPKLYFPNYYVAGEYLWFLVSYFALGFAIVFRMLYRAYALADVLHKNRIAYYFGAILIGYPLGALGFFLVYDIPLDPIFSVPFSFFIAPLAYGILRYDIMDIKSAARKTFAYMLFVLGTAAFIIGSNLGNDILFSAYPSMPSWIIPLMSSLVMVLFAGFIWEKVRDIESLKYEFITVVTHKFRTPLTRIRWASEIIKKHSDNDEDTKQSVYEIENANESLVVLTDMLINLRKANDSAFQYEFESSDLCMTVSQAVKSISRRAKDKGVDVSCVCPEFPTFASIDRRRMLFALQIVLDNALTYTPHSGKVFVTIEGDGVDAYIKVKDTGIGILKEDMARMFNKFWRSKEAKVTDTEGMGIGLFMAKNIIERHDGELSAESDGLGKGATFTVRLPITSE